MATRDPRLGYLVPTSSSDTASARITDVSSGSETFRSPSPCASRSDSVPQAPPSPWSTRWAPSTAPRAPCVEPFGVPCAPSSRFGVLRPAEPLAGEMFDAFSASRGDAGDWEPGRGVGESSRGSWAGVPGWGTSAVSPPCACAALELSSASFVCLAAIASACICFADLSIHIVVC